MGKYYGKIGYVIPKQTARGVYQDVDPVERFYYGDVLKASTSWDGTSHLNDDLKINVKISILTDEFADRYFSTIKYCEFMGVLWKVIAIEPARPRLVLTLGGEYNGKQT